MAKWRCEVIETRTYDVYYLIEADTIEEATRKAHIGDTIRETTRKQRDVINRDIWEGPTGPLVPEF